MSNGRIRSILGLVLIYGMTAGVIFIGHGLGY